MVSIVFTVFALMSSGGHYYFHVLAFKNSFVQYCFHCIGTEIFSCSVLLSLYWHLNLLVVSIVFPLLALKFLVVSIVFTVFALMSFGGHYYFHILAFKYSFVQYYFHCIGTEIFSWSVLLSLYWNLNLLVVSIVFTVFALQSSCHQYCFHCIDTEIFLWSVLLSLYWH